MRTRYSMYKRKKKRKKTSIFKRVFNKIKKFILVFNEKFNNGVNYIRLFIGLTFSIGFIRVVTLLIKGAVISFAPWVAIILGSVGLSILLELIIKLFKVSDPQTMFP